MISISKLNANVNTGDIKELTKILKQGWDGGKISIADTLQLLAK